MWDKMDLKEFDFDAPFHLDLEAMSEDLLAMLDDTWDLFTI
jgi:hypothetical protein